MTLDGAGTMLVVAQTAGGALVADRDIVGKWGDVTSVVERVSRDVLQAVKNAGPSRAVVELGFDLAIQSGRVVALFGQGKAEATIKVTLEWTKKEREVNDAPAGSPGAVAGANGR